MISPLSLCLSLVLGSAAPLFVQETAPAPPAGAESAALVQETPPAAGETQGGRFGIVGETPATPNPMPPAPPMLPVPDSCSSCQPVAATCCESAPTCCQPAPTCCQQRATRHVRVTRQHRQGGRCR